MSLRHRPVVAASIGTLLTAGTLAALPAVAGSPAPAATFSRPLILAGGGAEPSIRVPSDGKSAAYVSAPSGVGSNFWRITKTRNHDGSVTFNQSPVQQPDLGTGGGDSEISVGDVTQGSSSGCAPIAYTGLHNIDLLDNFPVASSTDCGKTFTLANPYGTQNTLTDRQWQVFDGAKTNFLIFHKVDTGQIVVTVSPDAGQHYVSLDPDGAHGIIEPQLLAASGTNQQIGNIIVNHGEKIAGKTNVITGEQVHAMYAIFGIADDTQTALQSQVPGSQYNGLDAIYVGKSVDGGVTWKDSLIYKVDPKTKRELNMLFPVITSDASGNLYAAWSDTYKIQYSVSTDHGAHWSKPYQVNRDNRGWNSDGSDKPDAGQADVFPWIAAGKGGLLDVAWYHGQGGSALSNKIYRDPGDAKTAWTVAFAQLGTASRTAGGTAAPKVLTYNQAITPVIHYGDICQNGTFCSLVPVSGAPLSTGDRSLLDFFQIAIDNDGRANLAIADNGTAPGQSISAYLIQLTGYSLTTGKKLPTLRVETPKLNCATDGAFSDPTGDATAFGVASAPSSAASADGLDLTKGWVTWDAAHKTATFHAAIKNLSSLPPGSTGQVLRFYFGWDRKGYDVQATKDAATGTKYVLQSSTTGGVSTIVTGLNGAFDTAKNEIRIELPADTFAKSSDAAFKAAPLKTGGQITGLKAETRRSYPAALAPVADDAAGLCPATLSAGSAAGKSHAAGFADPRFLPPAPTPAQVRSVVTRMLPAALVGLLMLAGAAAVTRRRTGLAIAS
ncbi:MAG: hypothetical protein JO079_11860 [Frankiaceae bacterium]|nr:hypothetical protein [Frankiaceae bacterium]MBV9369687.1 hypothetical protein [Frankiales bacterium]